MISSPTIFSLVGLVLFTGMTLPMPARQSQRTIIERIEIRGHRRCPEGEIRSRIKSKPGDLFDEEKLKLDLRTLYETGLFEDIQIDERDGDGGKIVTFTVKEKPIIGVVEFIGFKTLNFSDVEAYFKEHKVDVRVESLYDPARLQAAARALEQMLAEKGEPKVKVRTEVKPYAPNNMGVRFILGPKNEPAPKE